MPKAWEGEGAFPLGSTPASCARAAPPHPPSLARRVPPLPAGERESDRGEALQRRPELVAGAGGLLLALALLLDHLGLGLGEELLVRELLRDLVDLALELRHLARKPRLLLGHVDDVAERQDDGRLVEHRLDRALRRVPFDRPRLRK